MTSTEKAFLNRINQYSESVLGDIDPQKVQVSVQLEKLRPIMEEIAKETGSTLEDVFIKYMDLQSEATVLSNAKLQAELQDLNAGDGNPILFR